MLQLIKESTVGWSTALIDLDPFILRTELVACQFIQCHPWFQFKQRVVLSS